MRWYCLDYHGFVYAKTPQVEMLGCMQVFMASTLCCPPPYMCLQGCMQVVMALQYASHGWHDAARMCDAPCAHVLPCVYYAQLVNNTACCFACVVLQGMSLSKSVFSEGSEIVQAWAEDKVLTKVGAHNQQLALWTFTCDCCMHVTCAIDRTCTCTCKHLLVHGLRSLHA